MKITVFGSGYVGLVQATVFAQVGHDVLCVDIDTQRIKNLQAGIVPIYEPHLEQLIAEGKRTDCLHFTDQTVEAVNHADVLFIAVGTPLGENGSADISSVLDVATTIGWHRTKDVIIVDKSTVPVGTAQQVKETVEQVFQERCVSLNVHVVSNPEFMKEGAAVEDCRRPDRIIVGADNEHAREVMRELYQPFNRNHERMLFMDVHSAELTKYAANAMLATKISFMNEIANIAEFMGADIELVRQGIGSDPRIGYHFIYPGCGYGGSCFPKDVRALIHSAHEKDYQPELLKSVEAVNNRQRHKLFELIVQHFKSNLADRVIALWGLAFKPNTDDMREAPAIDLMEALWQAGGARVQAYDPEAMNEAQNRYGIGAKLSLMATKEATLINADALVICTEWQTFKAPDFDLIHKTLKSPVIFDGRNLYDPNHLKKRGFTYYGIGRGCSVNKDEPMIID